MAAWAGTDLIETCSLEAVSIDGHDWPDWPVGTMSALGRAMLLSLKSLVRK
jgi:hypothetical protein